MIKVVHDKFGNELQCGDHICFTVGGKNWKQTTELMRATVNGFITDKNDVDWILTTGCSLEAPSKIISSRVVKCY